MKDETCEGCTHRWWVRPVTYSTSTRGWGCLLSGGHAVRRCDAFIPLPEYPEDDEPSEGVTP